MSVTFNPVSLTPSQLPTRQVTRQPLPAASNDQLDLTIRKAPAIKFGRDYKELKGKVALVTGSSSGIGLGIAKEFVRQGCKVVLNSFEAPEKVQSVVDEIKQEFPTAEVVYVQADMSKTDQIKNLVKEAVKNYGGVDILVNSAGIQHVETIENFPPEKFEALLRINMMAPFYTAQEVLPLMKKKGWGRIIDIGSIHSIVGSAGKAPYVMSKFGVRGLDKVAALENAKNGITVNTICPGYVLTPLVEKQIPDQMKLHNMSREDVIKKVMLAKQPIERFVTVEEIAGTAAFLASDIARSITGTEILVDGAATAQ
jgi:3-hydroxybutyrate dehydrogenase